MCHKLKWHITFPNALERCYGMNVVEDSLHSPPTQIIMNLSLSYLSSFETAAEVIQTVITYGTKVYAIGSEIFTVSALLWVLNFLANMIEKTYNAGLIVGKFYRTYLHSHCKSAVLSIIAMSVLLSILFIQGCEKVYHNRQQILSNLNDFRNAIGRQFVYSVDNI